MNRVARSLEGLNPYIDCKLRISSLTIPYFHIKIEGCEFPALRMIWQPFGLDRDGRLARLNDLDDLCSIT